MSNRKPGDWWDQAWNPVTGCTPCSPACDHCWAQSFLKRFKQIHSNNDPRQVVLHENRLEAPLHWKKPRRVFVCNLSDLFHEDVPCDFLNRVFGVMRATPQHQYYVLTKRPDRMGSFLAELEHEIFGRACSQVKYPLATFNSRIITVPSNVMIGFTAWDNTSFQSGYDLLIDSYLGLITSDQPHPKWFVSLEPLLGPITSDDLENIDWIIVGGETGPKARPMQPEWVRVIRDQCIEAGVPFWFKSWGAWTPDVQPNDDPHTLKYLLDGQEWSQRPHAKNSTK